ncbi:MAG: AraC family transcriptional regulator [Bacteroidota bacterium]
MDPVFEKVPLVDSSFLVKMESFPHYEIPWHVHPEYELAYVTKANGKRFIGDSVTDVRGDDLILLGPNLPHAWISNAAGSRSGTVQQVIIQFSEDFLGANFWSKPEFLHIRQMLDKTSKGLGINGDSKARIIRKMYRLLKTDRFRRVIELLNILDLLATGKEYGTLSKLTIDDVKSGSESQRINVIYDYVLTNFRHKCTVPMVSSHFGMTPQSFCRYFKSRTRKTYIGFLNEVRISHACKLLSTDDLSIIEVCYNSGFESLSNFNRQFKRVTGSSPGLYRKSVLTSI